MDSPETYVSLYSGGGGLDLGFKRARPAAKCVAFVEHEASAAALLVDHVEAELVDAAPVYTDAFTFPAERFRGLVDWVIGGPPCQPFSVAGQRKGADDARNLWPLTLRMVGEIQPRGCFFENVPSADSLWYVYENVIPGLRYLGYEVEAGIFSAAEVGAPHNRERIFILAQSRHNESRNSGSFHKGRPANESGGTGIRQEWRAGATDTESGSRNVGHAGHRSRSTEQRQQPQGAVSGTGQPGEGTVANSRRFSGQVPQTGEPDRAQRDAAAGTSREMEHFCGKGQQGRECTAAPFRATPKPSAPDDTRCHRSERQIQEQSQRRDESQRASTQLGNADGLGRRAQDNGKRESSRADWHGRPMEWPPGPGETEKWEEVIRLRPNLAPATKPGVRGMANGVALGLARAQQLRILGNGVVPATAAHAFTSLYGKLA